MRVLVACEFSAVVRDAFRARGFDAWSCDLLPTEGDPRWHIQGDVRLLLNRRRYKSCVSNERDPDYVTYPTSNRGLHPGYVTRWDLVIAHPECTFLANSGAKHLYNGMRKENGPNPDRWAKMRAGAEFYVDMLDADADYVVAENPIMHGPARDEIERIWAERHPEESLPPVQYIQPHQHGHGETKATGLRIIGGLPPLEPSDPVTGREGRVWKMAPSADRWKERSRTLPGVAAAMAKQWGDFIRNPIPPIHAANLHGRGTARILNPRDLPPGLNTPTFVPVPADFSHNVDLAECEGAVASVHGGEVVGG